VVKCSTDSAQHFWGLAGLDPLSELAAEAEGGTDAEEGEGSGDRRVVFDLSMGNSICAKIFASWSYVGCKANATILSKWIIDPGKTKSAIIIFWIEA
jgi:hypothetical protein